MVGEHVMIDETPRLWPGNGSAVFCKTKDAFGGCSNMAGGFPITVNDVVVRTSEALYQAMRFPDHPDVQSAILAERSPMAAKFVAKAHNKKTRPDWMEVRVLLMMWCVLAKLRCNPTSFKAVLDETDGMIVIEKSFKDDFWGAKPRAEGLFGANVLGQIIMIARIADIPDILEPPPVPVMFLGEALRAIQ